MTNPNESRPELDAAAAVDDRPSGPEREIVIAALAAWATQEEAGRLVGRSGRTVRRWKKEDPELAQEVQQRRADQAAALAGRLTELGTQAIRVLEDALDDEAPRIRLRAAELVLSGGVRLRRATELDDALEEVLTFAKELQETYAGLEAKGDPR